MSVCWKTQELREGVQEEEEEMVAVCSLSPCLSVSLGGGTKMESTGERNVSDVGERVEDRARGGERQGFNWSMS